MKTKELYEGTLILLFKNNECIASEFKSNEKYLKKYYSKMDFFYENINKLREFCDNIYFITFSNFVPNVMQVIKFTKDSELYKESYNLKMQIELYKILKESLKINNNATLFIDNFVWWFQINKYIEKKKLFINACYNNFLEHGTALIHNYSYNPILNIKLIRNLPHSIKKDPTYYEIRIINNIDGNAETVYYETEIFTVRDIIKHIKKYCKKYDNFINLDIFDI